MMFIICCYVLNHTVCAQQESATDAVSFFREEYIASASSTLLRLSKIQNDNPNKNIGKLEPAVSRAAVSIVTYDESEKTSMIFLTFLYNLSIHLPNVEHAKIFELLKKEEAVYSSPNNLFILRQYGILWEISTGIDDEKVKSASRKIKIGSVEVLTKAAKKYIQEKLK